MAIMMTVGASYLTYYPLAAADASCLSASQEQSFSDFLVNSWPGAVAFLQYF